MLKAEIDAGKGLPVLVSHFGLKPDEQENAVKTVAYNLPQERCVLMGDFNMEPDNPILNPVVRTLRDTAQEFPMPKFSFPSDTPKVKLDYILVSKDVKVLRANIPALISSDHRPCVAEIELG